MQTIYLDISNKGVSPIVYAKQGDVGRKFQVVLTDSGLPHIPTGGSAFSVWYSGASGEGNYTNIDDKSAFTVNENKVIVEMISQMLSNDGDGVLSLVLNDPNGSQISTWNIPYFCEPVPGAESEEAQNYYTAFSRAVENLPYPDASLSVSGKAADSAAVGIRLAGKAPAGYGLGIASWGGGEYERITDAAKLDDLKANGFWAYQKSGSPLESNYTQTQFVAGYTVASGSGFVTQRAVTLYTGVWIERQLVTRSGVAAWEPWVYVNPPLEWGVEYRTTERHNGKVVWAKKIQYTTAAQIGNASSVTTVEIPHGVEGLTALVRAHGLVGTTAQLPYMERNSGSTSVIGVDDTNVKLHIINTTWDAGRTFTFDIRYTKD